MDEWQRICRKIRWGKVLVFDRARMKTLRWGETAHFQALPQPALPKTTPDLGPSGREKKLLLDRQTPCLLVRGRCSCFDATGVLVEGVGKTTTAYLFPVK